MFVVGCLAIPLRRQGLKPHASLFINITKGFSGVISQRMKKSTTIVILVFLLLIAFITNPTREKHVENGLEILFNTNDENQDYGIVGGLISTFEKDNLSTRININNYYLFSLSSLYLNDDNVNLRLGFGIFGQVFPLSNYENYKIYKDDYRTLIPLLESKQKNQVPNKSGKADKETTEALNKILNGPESEE